MQELSVQIPAGIKCTGGTSKNLCLSSFTTTAGFGNCVVVSQGAGTAKGIRAEQDHVDAAHHSPDKKDGGSKKNKLSKTGEKTHVNKKDAAIKNDNLSKKGDTSKKAAAPTNAGAQPAPKNPAPKSALPQRPTTPKTTVPEKSKKPAPSKKDEKEKGNTRKRGCKCQLRRM
jgi:hypothetical protein